MRIPFFRFTYQSRMLTSTAAVLLLVIALIHGWPAPTETTEEGAFRARSPNRVTLRDIQPTAQSRERTPSPPAPLPPVVVPNDVLVPEAIEFGDATLRIENPDDDAEHREGVDQAMVAQQPETDARLLRNVQPNYPSAARDNDVRARIEIEVQISEKGQVQNAMIRKRWRLAQDGTSRPVVELGYGLEEAALAAAQSSLFRPARSSGRAVATHKTITFTFGIH